MHSIGGTEVFSKLEKSVILDGNQDHYHLITSLHCTYTSIVIRLSTTENWLKRTKRKTENWVKLSLSQFLWREHPSILMNFFFRWCQLTETTNTSKEQNIYVKEILSMVQAAYWLTLLRTTLRTNLHSHCS